MLSYLATATLAIGALLGTSDRSSQWESSYGKALEASRAADAPLLVVLDKPNAKEARLAPELLDGSAAEGEKDALRPYQLCHVDVTTSYGKKVAKAFQAKTFPHVAIIDKTGSTVIFRKAGKIQADEWQRILARHKSGDRSLAKSVSRTTYKPSSDVLKPYCPNCQRNSNSF